MPNLIKGYIKNVTIIIPISAYWNSNKDTDEITFSILRKLITICPKQYNPTKIIRETIGDNIGI